MTLPLVEELTPCPNVMSALRAVARWPNVLLLESALQREHVGRYSFLMADPVAVARIDAPQYGLDPFQQLREWQKLFSAETVPDLPPFQGGMAGLLSYELGRCWERIPAAKFDEFQLPAMVVGLYDWVIAWDHQVGRAWILSHGLPIKSSHRRERAAERLKAVYHALQQESGVGKPDSTGWQKDSRREASVENHAVTGRQRVTSRGNDVEPIADHSSVAQHSALRTQHSPSDSPPHHPAPGLPGLTSNFSRDGYLRAVQRVIEYIRAGDIFQANLSQRLLYPAVGEPIELYARLRECNPAPFAGYFAHDDWAVVSASPERFVCLRDGEVETRPIKGTRRRPRPHPEADLFTRDELRESEKDQAENVMIVDLLRNDLSRVCRPGSIRVPQLCHVETYETVQHLVSEVRGTLTEGRNAWDLLHAVFPGGSITGAPKVRAMEIIAELEPTVRGPYTGSLFYVGFDGQADSSILIRTFTLRHGWVQCSVGGGIVAQSDPVAEYEETLHKAAGMLQALKAWAT